MCLQAKMNIDTGIWYWLMKSLFYMIADGDHISRVNASENFKIAILFPFIWIDRYIN